MDWDRSCSTASLLIREYLADPQNNGTRIAKAAKAETITQQGVNQFYDEDKKRVALQVPELPGSQVKESS
jgi:hypothetical protein